MILSDCIIGTMRWGVWGENKSINQMAELIECAVSYEFTSFDLADIYGGYTTEAEFGNAFHSTQIPREKVQFITKCGIGYPSENSVYKTKIYDTSSAHIKASVENSLSHLRTDYVDVLLIHRPNPLIDYEEVQRAVSELLSEGKILHFGVSNFSTQQLDYLHSSISVECVQNEFSLMQPDSLFDGTLLQAQKMNWPVMAWSPIGKYYQKNTNEELKISVAAFAAKYNCSENLILLSWIRNNPAQIFPIIGTTQKERIAELQQLPNIQLTPEEWYLLLEKSRGKKVD